MTEIFVKPVKNQSAWRPVLSRLELLNQLIDVFGISKNGNGFELEPLMAFVGKSFVSANPDVRSMGGDVALKIARIVGPAIRKYLPKDTNNKIREQIEDVLENHNTIITTNNNLNTNNSILEDNHQYKSLI